VVDHLAVRAVVDALPYAGKPWLVREILRGAGDLVVLEPQDARDAIAKEVD
jgi:proteasome accessory factor C